MINVLLCSSSGFSGKNILYKLSKNKKYNIVATYKKRKTFTSKKNVKLIKQDLVKKFKFKFPVNYVILCANKHKIEDFKKESKKNYINNLLIAKRVVEYTKNYKSPTLIYFSTVDISYNNIPSNKKVYIKSKIESEKIFLSSLKNKIFKKVIFLRLPALLGKDCNKNFLSNAKTNLISDTKIHLWNSDSNYNNYVHIEDVIRLIEDIIYNNKKYKNKCIIDCLVSSPISTFDTINLMKRKLNSKSDLIIEKKTRTELKLKKELDKKNFNFFSSKKTIKLFIKD